MVNHDATVKPKATEFDEFDLAAKRQYDSDTNAINTIRDDVLCLAELLTTLAVLKLERS